MVFGYGIGTGVSNEGVAQNAEGLPAVVLRALPNEMGQEVLGVLLFVVIPCLSVAAGVSAAQKALGALAVAA